MKIKLNLFLRSFIVSFVVLALVAGIIIASLYIDRIAIDPLSGESNLLVGIADKGELLSIIVINFDPANGRIRFLPIPDNTLLEDSLILQDQYAKNGIEVLCSRVEELTGATIDRYAVFSPDAISALTDRAGVFTYLIPYKFVYNGRLCSGQTEMDGELAKAMFTYKGYDMNAVSISQMSLSFMNSFLSKHTNAVTISKLEELLLSGELNDDIKTDLTSDEISSYCTLFTSYSSYSNKTLSLPGTIYDASSSKYFIPDTLVAENNIFK